MDILVPITMKNAAKCDTQCELQNSASHQIFERKLRLGDILWACLFQCVKFISHTLMRLRFVFLVKYEWVKLSFQRSGQLQNWLRWVKLSIKNSLINFLQSTPEIKQDHPLNLSISVSGGKETNKDCLSSGERSGKSSKWKSACESVWSCKL
jgi:hypothetical protein